MFQTLFPNGIFQALIVTIRPKYCFFLCMSCHYRDGEVSEVQFLAKVQGLVFDRNLQQSTKPDDFTKNHQPPTPIDA